MWSLKPFKAPSLDGLHRGFFSQLWLLVGVLVKSLVLEVFNSGIVPSYLNQTLITLIPKHPGADCIFAFRPISLCNTIYKTISKVIVVRLRPHLEDIISPLQAAFVPNRWGVDNVIIIQELLHTMSQKKEGKVGFMAIKIDLEKAYDRLEWGFIKDTLSLFNVPEYLGKVIMNCISTLLILVLVNDGALEPFQPPKGIQQDDPMSPYIFIMCMKVLGFLIKDKCDSNLGDLVYAF